MAQATAVRGRWTADDISDQAGRIAVVTGANSGLGYQTSLALARHHARVVMACRDPHRAADALGRLRAAAPGADVTTAQLDLADLESVRRFARTIDAVDLLINNAGVMALPSRRLTAQGFEMQVGTNHLGHFALTGLLLPKLRGGRVVTVSSFMHAYGRLTDLADLNSERAYRTWRVYGLSKLANILFFTELARRYPELDSLGAHPGYAATNLQATPKSEGATLASRFLDVTNRVVAQSDAMGALPTLRAATDPESRSGEYYGPSGLSRGYPKRVSHRKADPAAAARLWADSERLTGVTFGH